jgi:multisubunit Na+/H+ antiporter MnhF subunit
MNEWLLAAVLLTGGLVPLTAVCARSRPLEGLVALELAGAVGSVALLLVSEGTQRQPFADLALVSAFLSLAGSLAYARLLERRL